jgi:hypothetical protein
MKFVCGAQRVCVQWFKSKTNRENQTPPHLHAASSKLKAVIIIAAQTSKPKPQNFTAQDVQTPIHRIPTQQ